MKHLIALSLILLPLIGFSQNEKKDSSQIKKQVKFESFDVTVTINSAKELEETFKMEDIIEIINTTDENEELSFKIICNGDTMSNGQKSNLTFKVDGSSDKKENFLEQVEKIRTTAIKYYNSKQ